MAMTNTRELNITLRGKEQSYTFSFAPGTALFEVIPPSQPQQPTKYFLTSFILNRRLYIYKKNGQSKNDAANNIFDKAKKAVGGGVVGVAAGSAWAVRGMQIGGVLGAIAALGLNEIIQHYSSSNDEGYYCDGSLIYLGNVILT